MILIAFEAQSNIFPTIARDLSKYLMFIIVSLLHGYQEYIGAP